MIRRFLPPLVALVSSSCLLEDPYYIDEGASLTSAEDAEPEAPRDDTSTSDDDTPEPEAVDPLTPDAKPTPAEPEPQPALPEPTDILVDPPSTLPEPVAEPAVLEPVVTPSEPVPEPAPSPPEPMPESPPIGVDAGMPEPPNVPSPAPEPTPELDAGVEPCVPASPGCAVVSACGNGSVEEDEVCDGEDLALESCYSQGFSGGTLSCSLACQFDVSECIAGPSCEATTTGSTGLVYEGNLNGSRNDVRSYSCSLGGRDAEDVTLSWTAPTSGCVTISVDSIEAIDTIIGVFEDCSIDHELACDNEHNSSDPDSILQFEAVANTTYALAIDAYEPGDEATIQVTIAQCAPSDWTCTLMSYGDGQSCDCGCGAHDPDCADSAVDSCDTCSSDGACSYYYGCQDIDEEQNWTCDYGGPFGR